MSDLANYFLAQEKVRVAIERRNYAGMALDNARVKERLAEIKSQHQPLADLVKADMPERDKLYAIAFYVAVGRMP